jgi:hypothetical protein
MRNFLLSIAGVFALLSTTVFAVEPGNDLSARDAVRLIVLKSDVPENTVEIAFIIEGSVKCEKDFEVKHVRRVAAIHPVRDGTGPRRTLVFYDLYWNESLGWFMWESRPERSGDAVYIWSELKGQIVNR